MLAMTIGTVYMAETCLLLCGFVQELQLNDIEQEQLGPLVSWFILLCYLFVGTGQLIGAVREFNPVWIVVTLWLLPCNIARI